MNKYTKRYASVALAVTLIGTTVAPSILPRTETVVYANEGMGGETGEGPESPTLTGLTLIRPNICEYGVGNEFAPLGMTITGTYSNNETLPIADVTLTLVGPDSKELTDMTFLQTGVHHIKATYGGLSATYELIVKGESRPIEIKVGDIRTENGFTAIVIGGIGSAKNTPVGVEITSFDPMNSTALVDGELTIPATVDGLEITTIGSLIEEDQPGVFEDKGITNVIFSSDIEDIGERAFANNNITNLNLTTKVQVIMMSAFANNNMKIVNFGTGLRGLYEESFANNDLTSIILPSSLDIGLLESAFKNNRRLENITYARTEPSPINSAAFPREPGQSIANVTVPTGSEAAYISSLEEDILAGNLIVNQMGASLKQSDGTPVTASPVISGGKRSDSVLTGKMETLEGIEVEGTFQWALGFEYQVEPKVDYNRNYLWMFIPTDSQYRIETGIIKIGRKTVGPPSKSNPIVDSGVKATPIVSGETVSKSILSGTFKNALGEAIPGILKWSSREDDVLTEDTVNKEYKWEFVPTDTETYNTWTGVVTIVVTPKLAVVKTNPIVNKAITATPIKSGQRLDASTLSGAFKNALGEAIPGILKWSSREDDILIQTTEYKWAFFPTDTSKYNTLTGGIDVVVTPEPVDSGLVQLPTGDKPIVNIPVGDNKEYKIPITSADSNKEVTVNIPTGSKSKVVLDLKSNLALPKVEVIKDNISAVISKGTKITKGDASKLELITNKDATDKTVIDKVKEFLGTDKTLDSISHIITMGGNNRVEFDDFVTLTFKGSAGKDSVYIQNGIVYPIQNFSSDAEGRNSGKAEYSYYDGDNLIIKTKHFTDFVISDITDTETTSPDKLDYNREGATIFEKKLNQAIDKSWTIRFNGKVQNGEYLKDSVHVVDENGFIQDITFEMGKDGKSIIITPPTKGYKSGQGYTIVVKGVKDIKDNIIKTTVILDFTIN